MKNGGNETYEPPFRGVVVISQNAEVSASDAILQRICHLNFTVSEHSQETRVAAEKLERTPIESVSGFLLKAIRAEGSVMKTIREKTPVYEAQLLAHPEIRSKRICKNHAQIMALLDALDGVIEIGPTLRDSTQKFVVGMAVERQGSINADHPVVQEFWEVYEYLNGLDSDPRLNHSRDENLIAISLPHFVQVAADRKQQIPPVSDLKRLLKTSRLHKFVGVRAVNSVINSAYNAKSDPSYPEKPTTVKAWIFQR